MVAGLQPETFGSFIQQRGRWATGMIQLLMTCNPFRIRGLSLFLFARRLSLLTPPSPGTVPSPPPRATD